jgi:hypothetical protein
MNLNRRLLLFFPFFFISTLTLAQIEVARYQNKDFSATGFGAFLNVGMPVAQNAAITTEAGLYVFVHDDTHIAITPLLLGYRQLLSQEDHGWYAEPLLGYSFSFTDIQKYDANGNAIYGANGNQVDQKMNGPTAGAGFGYLFKRSDGAFPIQFNIGIRYEHVFASGYPSPNIFALRISHAFSFGRRD